MEDDVVPSRTRFAMASWLTPSIYCITNIPAVGMEHTMANIRTAYGKRNQVDSSSSAKGNGFVSTLVSRTGVPTFKKREKKQILQILRYDCSGGKIKLKHLKRYYADICQVGDEKVKYSSGSS